MHTRILGQYDCYTTHTHTQTHRETSASPIREIGTKPTVQLVLFHSLSLFCPLPSTMPWGQDLLLMHFSNYIILRRVPGREQPFNLQFSKGLTLCTK